jgi:hypothetical protein
VTGLDSLRTIHPALNTIYLRKHRIKEPSNTVPNNDLNQENAN